MRKKDIFPPPFITLILRSSQKESRVLHLACGPLLFCPFFIVSMLALGVKHYFDGKTIGFTLLSLPFARVVVLLVLIVICLLTCFNAINFTIPSQTSNLISLNVLTKFHLVSYGMSFLIMVAILTLLPFYVIFTQI